MVRSVTVVYGHFKPIMRGSAGVVKGRFGPIMVLDKDSFLLFQINHFILYNMAIAN